MGALFGGLWLFTAFHLLVVMHREVWEWDWFFILSCAAPPVLLFGWLVRGDPASTGLSLATLSVVAFPWWLAARRPTSRWRFRIACAAIVAYWAFHDFGLALAA